MHCFEHPEQSESWYQSECQSKELFLLQKTYVGDEGRWLSSIEEPRIFCCEYIELLQQMPRMENHQP